MNNGQAAASPIEALQALVSTATWSAWRTFSRNSTCSTCSRLSGGSANIRRSLRGSLTLMAPTDCGTISFADSSLRQRLRRVSEESRTLRHSMWTAGNSVDIEIATERHDIDVLLIDVTDGFVCLIENKIGAGEHSDQLSRYLETVEREYEGLSPFPIFLTPDGVEPESEDDVERYVPLDYGTVADLIERTLRTRGSTISTSVAGFLEQYARNLRRHVLDTTDNIDELALQIYDNHRAAIDLIIKARPALEAKGWDVIDAAIEQYAPSLRADFHNKSYHRYFSPELDEIPDLKDGSRWTKSGRMLLFEFKFRERVLVMMLGPGPEQTRRRLYELVQNGGVPGVDMRRARNLSKTYHTLYSKPLLGKGSSSQPDYEKSRPQVERVIAEFFENDYWPMVNAPIRGEFGLPPSSIPSMPNAKTDR